MLSFKQYLIEHMSQEELSKKLEVPLSAVQELTPEELDTILKWVGNHDFVPDSKFDAKELAMGIKIEMEHTKNEIVAKLIAKDHLSEPGSNKYYSNLLELERNMKLEKSKNND